MTELIGRLQAALGDTYRVERELARGGMSLLYFATEVSLNRSVVIKLLPPETSSEVSAARFQREIAVAAQLQHPHILPVHAAGARDGLIWYVMPYVEGESLRKRLELGPMAVEEGLRLLAEVAGALAYAHERGVVHRDIKPENILLQQNHAVLTDFGVARAIAEARHDDKLTTAGIAIGTPGYMSPEQAAGDSVDARSDVYALAVVGYEVLSGAPPFSAPSAQAMLAAHLTQTPRPIQDLRPEVPPSAARALVRALAKDPAERFATAAGFRDALTAGGPVQGRGPVKGRRLLAGFGTAALVALIALVLWWRDANPREDPRKSLIVFPFENLSGDSSQQYLQEAAMNLLGLAVSHWEDVRVFDDERTKSLLRRRNVTSAADIDFELAQSMARDAGVGTLVLGDIRRVGDSIEVEAKIHDVRSGERIATETARAPIGSDPRPLFDILAASLLRIAGAPAGERPGLVTQTTRSLAAYRSYLAGIDALQRFELDTAEIDLARAVQLDSNFTLAYLRLRDVNGWRTGGSPAYRRALVAMAQMHSADLPPRVRRLVDYYAAYEDGQLADAREIAQELVERDSTDVEAWYQLGESSWHDNSQSYPRVAGAGNVGAALRAFQRALALDSGYTVAYEHILDGLAYCTTTNVVVCLADSAVYGTPDSLRARFGAEAVTLQKQQTREQWLATARGWTNAAPRSLRARPRLLGILIGERRFPEAETQIEALRTTRGDRPASLWRGYLAFVRQRYGEGARFLRNGLAGETDTAGLLFNERLNEASTGILVAGGRVREARRMSEYLLLATPQDSTFMFNQRVPMSVALTAAGILADLDVDLNPASAARRAHELVDSLVRGVGAGTPRARAMAQSAGAALITAYVVSRDTTLLTRVMENADTLNSLTWRSAHAQLSLARGDSVSARRRIDDVLRNLPAAEFDGNYGVPRLFAWADLLARLGDRARAVELFSRLDTLRASEQHPGLVVRSWLERGALYQAMGQAGPAAEAYTKFIDAWKDADPSLQPVVDRARTALAALSVSGAVSPRR